MNVRSFHLGNIDPDRQACIDKQKKAYGSDYELIKSWPVGFLFKESSDIRESKDVLFVEMMLDGYFVMDTDVIPLVKWYPDSEGLWLPHSFGRIENYMGVAVGSEAIEYVQGMLIYYLSEQPGFNWMLEFFAMYPGPFQLIPSDKFNHLGLTYTKTNSLIKG
jgi:hypothetical protein